jgi:hypothetical protein
MRSLLMIVVLLLSVFVKPTLAADPNLRLAADLALQFVCKESRRDDIEKNMEAFLKKNGFKILNLGEIQRQHDVYLIDTNIVALNGDQRMVEMRSVPLAERRYSFYLYSRPPTDRSDLLERNILSFVSESLKCDMRQIARNENGKERARFYESQVRRVEGLFDEADRINGGGRL